MANVALPRDGPDKVSPKYTFAVMGVEGTVPPIVKLTLAIFELHCAVKDCPNVVFPVESGKSKPPWSKLQTVYTLGVTFEDYLITSQRFWIVLLELIVFGNCFPALSKLLLDWAIDQKWTESNNNKVIINCFLRM